MKNIFTILLTMIFGTACLNLSATTLCKQSHPTKEVQEVHITTDNDTLSLPYFQNFESGSALEFTFQNSSPDGWYIGTATGMADPENPGAATHSLYVSNDQGVSYASSLSGNKYSYAILEVQFPTGDEEWHLTFDYKVPANPSMPMNMGLASLSVFLLEPSASLPTNAMPVGDTLLYDAYGVADWIHGDYVLPNVGGATKKIVFVWYTHSWASMFGVSGAPAAVDNIGISGSSCAQPVNLTVTAVTETSATLSWTETGSASFWDVYMKETNSSDAYTLIPAYDTSITISTLSPNTLYSFYVEANCGGTVSNPSPVVTKRTLNDPVQLPYEQDFEGPLAEITEFTFENGLNGWFIGTAAGGVDTDTTLSVSHSMYISDDNGVSYSYDDAVSAHSYTILDVEFPMDAVEWHLSFDYKVPAHSSSSSSGYGYAYLSVYIMDVDDEITPYLMPPGTPLMDIVYDVSDWTHADFVLENVAGTRKRIVFHWMHISYASYYLQGPPAAIDNIHIASQDCAQPNLLTATNVSANSATLGWTEVGSATAWTVYYKPVNDTAYTVSVANDTTLTVSNLAADTYYEFYVTADCGEEPSNPSASLTFKTGCGDLTYLPYTVDFSDFVTVDGGPYVDCWSRLASDSAHMVYHSDSYVYSHNYSSGCLDFNNTTDGWTIAVMPAFATSILVNTLMLEFWLDKTGNTGTFEVGVMSDPTDSATFVVVDTIENATVGNYSYEQKTVSLASYHGTGRYIAFRASNGGYRLDDLVITAIPECAQPNNLQVTYVNQDTVSLSWTEMGTATSWVVSYGPQGIDPENAVMEAVQQDSVTITGLVAGTIYDFYVKAGCESEWEGPVSAAGGQYLMAATGSDTLTTCAAVIYDDGGAFDYYSNQANSILVLYPATPGAVMSLSGVSNTETNSDFLNIYDGAGTAGTQLGHYSGEQTVSAISTTGPLTIEFTSNFFISLPGFELVARCATCIPPTGLTVSNVTMSGAVLSWNGSADSYAVMLCGADTAYYTTSGTSYTLANLTPATSYTVYVRSLCASDSSFLSQPLHFQTACGALTVTATQPWTEDFEGYDGSGVMELLCWGTPETHTEANGTFPAVYGDQPSACHSGVNSVELKGSSNMLVLPEFTNDIHDLRLSFYATSTNPALGALEVGVVTNPEDPTSFEVLGVCNAPSNRGSGGASIGSFGNLIGPFDFNGVQATSGRMALRYSNTNANVSWNLDDFVVELGPDCPSPVKTSVAVSSIDGHHATVTFTDNDPSHNSWTVYYKVAADSVWNTVIATTTSATLSNLLSETTYEVYVVTNCSTTDTPLDATYVVQFTTTVNCPTPTNVQVTSLGMTSATITWESTADSFSIEYGDFGFTPGNGTTITSNTTSCSLSGLTDNYAYTVYITALCGGMDGNSEPASIDFTTLLCDSIDRCAYTLTLTDAAGNGWNNASLTVQQSGITVATVTMSNGSTATETIYLCDNLQTTLIWNTGYHDADAGLTLTDPTGVQLISISNMLTISSANFFIFTTNCAGSVISEPTATTYAATNVTQTTATLNGSIANPSYITIIAQGFEWKAVQSGTYTKVYETGYDMTHNLTGLTANTNYTYRTFVTTANGTSYGNDVTFTTLEAVVEPCNTPTGLTANVIAKDNIVIVWDNDANVNSWNIQYRQVGVTNWNTGNSTTNTYTITGLTPETQYEIQVQADCGDGNLSDWTAAITHTTQPDGIENHLSNSITLFPNPAKDAINVQCTMNNVQSVEVIDVYGKVVRTVVETVHAPFLPIRINVSGLANGMYFVRVTTEEGTVTKRFVKR